MSSEESTSSPTVPPGQDPDDATSVVTVTPHSLVTKELVETALRNDKGPGAKLVSWECQDFTRPGDNSTCVVSSVKVDYTLGDEENHVTYIVKLNPCSVEDSFDDMTHCLFRKEGLFYQDLVPELNKCLREAGMAMLSVPKFFNSHLELKKEVIFLEDLRPRGFKMFDRKKGQDFAHAQLILKELGRLHAASVLFQRQNPNTSLMERFPFLEDFWAFALSQGSDIKSVFSNNLAGAKSIAESTPGYEHVVKWIEDISLKAVDIIREEAIPSSAALTVINHGDCWTNNLLFRYNDDGHPVEATLLDFQMSRASDPGCDISNFLYTSLTGEDRTAHLDDFLDIYYDSFKQVLDAGKTQVPYNRRELVDNFEDHHMYGIMIGITFAPLSLMDFEDVLDMSKVKQVTLMESFEEWKQALRRTAQSNPMAQSRLLCLFDNLIKRGKIPSKQEK